MSRWTRFINVFRGDRVSHEIDEELEAHIASAIEDGCDPVEARRLLGPALQYRETSRDTKLIPWIESLRADTVFGLRQLKKHRVTSAAAILSLALAIGACTSAFRLVDALLLRPLPIAEPGRLYITQREGLTPEGQPRTAESLSYPLFRNMRATVSQEAEVIAVSRGVRTDITYGSDQQMEKAYRQYVSGWMFTSFGLHAAVGRVFTERDDTTPGGHPYAVLSHEYWQRRFAGDPSVIGRTFRMGSDLYQIVGVAEKGFTGTEPGTFVDVFVPIMMNARAIHNRDTFWIRAFVLPASGRSVTPLRDRMDVVYRSMERDRAKGFTHLPSHVVADYPKDKIILEKASAGISAVQKDYRLSLTALGILVALVLLIACANIANLMTARAAARAREMALRVSIGAGRARLLQLVLVESAWVATLATVVGGLLAWWAAPLVVSLINPPDNPARLHLPFDWRLMGFAVTIAFCATLLFGLAPALRASGVKPASALKGGEDPHARKRLMRALICVQVAFCVVVLVIGALFVATYDRLAGTPTGYSSERLLALETVTPQPQPPIYWEQVAAHLRSVPGVESVAYSEWPVMSGEMWNQAISINGAPPSEILTFMLPVSPGWLQTMKLPLTEGRDFRPEETHPGAAIVNHTFARQYFQGENPVGKSFDIPQQNGPPRRYQIVGMVKDARYDNVRTPIPPVAYVPYTAMDQDGQMMPKGRAAFMVRTVNPDPAQMMSALRREVSRARPEFRVTNARTQEEIDNAHTIRERLLAMLALFFSATALLLAGVGLYGVLDYSVLQRRREIGIRMALGANWANVVRRVTWDVFALVVLGAALGVAAGLSAERYIRTLLFGVTSADLTLLSVPLLSIAGVAMLAALPAVIRAVRIDPAKLLRAD